MFKALNVFLSLFVITVAASAADGVSFLNPTSWEEAQSKAKAEKKFLFVDAYTDWCGWCKVMDKETFSDARVAELMNEKFTSVRIEMETGFGVDVAMKYRVRSFPQFLVFNPEGDLVYRIFGYSPPEGFIPQLEASLNPETQMKFPGVTQPMNVEYPEFLSGVYGKGKDRLRAEPEEIDAWLSEQDDLTSEAAWTVLTSINPGEKWDNWIIDNREPLTAKYGMEVDARIERILMQKMAGAIEEGNKENLESALMSIPDADPKKKRVSVIMRARFSAAQKEWNHLADLLTMEYRNETIDGAFVNEMAWTMYEECDETLALMEVSTIMKHVVETDGGWAEYDTYAALLYKLERYEVAQPAAEKAIELGKAANANVSETEALLEKIKAGGGR